MVVEANEHQEALLLQSFALAPVESNSPSPLCDCLAHRFGNAADGPGRVRCYGSDLTDVEWQVIQPLPPVPAWFQGRGGRPEGHCHRVMLDAVRYVENLGSHNSLGRHPQLSAMPPVRADARRRGRMS